MYQNFNGEAVGFGSSWKTNAQRKHNDSQTEEINFTELGVQAISIADSSIQTELHANLTKQKIMNDEENSRLASFLLRAESLVVRELDKARKSNQQISLLEKNKAMVEVSLEPTVCTRVLTRPAEEQQDQRDFVVTCMAWNTTGAEIAVGEGWPKHDTWCGHEARICVYNINNQSESSTTELQSSARKSNCKIIPTPSCVTVLRYHPEHASFLIAGTAIGDLLVLGQNSELLQRLVEHSQAVTGITYLSPLKNTITTQQYDSQQTLLSADLEGKLITWSLDGERKNLIKQQCYGISCRHLPGKLKSVLNNDEFQPVTALSQINKKWWSKCLVGTEAGCIFMCDVNEPRNNDPVEFQYEGHQGAVVRTLSPHPADEVFASCASYHEIHVYNLHQPAAIRSITLTTNCLGAIWNISGLLTTWNNNEIQVLSMEDEISFRTIIPMQKQIGVNHSNITALVYNPIMSRILAVGYIDGITKLWKLQS